ncbi:MAG: alpha/beta family hydrolase [Acidimicrobiales bacterium]|nr:alpha/beta family hydrolase [Acidimicrobiales bacterium]
MLFEDRLDAGRQLAQRVEHLRDPQPVVVGLPRGGVPVAAEVASRLGAPLDVLLVRKIGVPSQPELAMGAIGEGGVRVVNQEVVRMARVAEDQWAAVEQREWAELERRAQKLRGPHPRLSLEGRVVVLVDDGIATGSTARAACRVARAAGAKRVVLAVPVAPGDWTETFAGEADELIALATPEPFQAVGRWYRRFDATSDEEVEACLSDNANQIDRHAHTEARAPASLDDEMVIPCGAVDLEGHLTVPPEATGVVVFAHGSGSSRHSPRNQYVASVLNDAGIGTLLFDLLTDREAADRRAVFDIDLLAGRLVTATTWLRSTLDPDGPAIGYFGASTGAAAALQAAAEADTEIAAVVSRGGRPDLAGPHLGAVRAPTLLIVGGDDTVVLDLNRSAQQQMQARVELVVIPGATHLFEEPGTLEAAAGSARDWFLEHFDAAT